MVKDTENIEEPSSHNPSSSSIPANKPAAGEAECRSGSSVSTSKGKNTLSSLVPISANGAKPSNNNITKREEKQQKLEKSENHSAVERSNNIQSATGSQQESIKDEAKNGLDQKLQQQKETTTIDKPSTNHPEDKSFVTVNSSDATYSNSDKKASSSIDKNMQQILIDDDTN